MDPLTMALIMGGTGLLGALGGSQKGTQAQMSEDYINKIYGLIPQIKNAGYSMTQLQSMIPQIQKYFTGASDVAAGKIGAAIGESGTPQGQPFAEYYTQSLAPVIAQGQEMAGQTQEDMTKFIQSNEMSKISAMLQAYNMAGGALGGLSKTNPTQGGLLGFLQGTNIGASAIGNITQLLTALNKKYPDLGGGGNNNISGMGDYNYNPNTYATTA